MSDAEPWPPQPPDITNAQLLEEIELRPFEFTMFSQLHKFKHAPLVYKDHGSQREFDMMISAGDCAVKARGRVFSRDERGYVYLEDIFMDLEKPLKCKNLDTDASERELIMRHMIFCVESLHSMGVIHGDIKPNNMLRCSDGRLRLCDFGEARRIDDPSVWEGMLTVNYCSPDRSYYYPNHAPPPPTVNDDLYGLGLSIWELYTGNVPFDGIYEDDIVDVLKRGGTVDVGLVQQLDVQRIIAGFLRQGGAKV